jgi:xanthine dehydrogenase YagS FAD-binding subunit
MMERALDCFGGEKILAKTQEAASSMTNALASLALQLQFEGRSVSRSRVVLGGVAPKPWPMPQVEEVLQNSELDNATIMKACDLLGADARPLAHNGYKIPLIKGLLQEALRKLMETIQF